jgi:hypothetical protein
VPSALLQPIPELPPLQGPELEDLVGTLVDVGQAHHECRAQCNALIETVRDDD